MENKRKINDSCEVDEDKHRYEFDRATPEVSVWVCKLCGKEVIEYEDCGTGA